MLFLENAQKTGNKDAILPLDAQLDIFPLNQRLSNDEVLGVSFSIYL